MTPRILTIAELRRRAEARLGNTPRRPTDRELEVHKLELEMQNEELRRAYAELETARDRYRELFEVAPVAYMALDRSGRICSVNRAACELTGLQLDQLVGIRLAALMSLDDADRLHLYLAGLFTGGPRRIVLDLLVPHAPLRVTLDSSTPADGSILTVLTDASAASTGTIAHEVNNILQVIGASIASVENVPACEATLQHCKDLVQRLLAFGLSEQQPHPREVVVDELVTRTIEVVRPLLGSSVHVEAKLGAPKVRVACDPSELELVLINLASNAHDAMPAGGRFTISTRVVGKSPESRHLVLLVQDSGHGMSETLQGHIFEPFFTTKRGGTGLGLATSRGIIERAKGTISVSSTPWVGTTFEIALPILKPASPRFAQGTQSRPRVPLAELEKRTVMIVEDNMTTRFAMQEHLETLGYHVITADGMMTALSAARAQHVDLALLDYRLRSMSGELLARHLREINPEVRVILMSGYPREQITTDEYFLQKPFSLDELTRAVTAALTGA